MLVLEEVRVLGDFVDWVESYSNLEKQGGGSVRCGMGNSFEREVSREFEQAVAGLVPALEKEFKVRLAPEFARKNFHVSMVTAVDVVSRL